MKIAVTGAHGKVGQAVINDLLNNDYEVRAITHSHWNECPVDQVSADITNYEQVYDALDGCQAVIHLAAIPSPRKNADTLVIHTNVIGNYNIMLAAGNQGIKHIAAASSDCAFGFTYSLNRPKPVYLPVDEQHPTRPDDCYGLSKVLSERTADAMVQRFPGISIASLRITHVINPEEYSPDSYFSQWHDNPEAGPWNLWSYIDARDAARAFRLAIETNLNGHEIFCIAAPNTRCSIPSAVLIEKYFPTARLKKTFTDHESLEDSSKAEQILGFKAIHRWDI